MRPLTEVCAAPYALGIADNSVTTSKIVDGAITIPKMANNFVGQLSFGLAGGGQVNEGKGKNVTLIPGVNISMSETVEPDSSLQVIIDGTQGNFLKYCDRGRRVNCNRAADTR